MIHLFPTFSNDASQSPLAQELRALDVPHRLFAERVVLRYRNRLWLLLAGMPRMAWFATKSALRSFTSGATPRVVILGSDVEVLVFGLLRLLLFRRRTRIAWLCFIYTGRKQPVRRRLHLAYYRCVMSFVDVAICHSSLECERYRELFGRRTRFEFVPCGLHLVIPALTTAAEPYIFSAGRSGRDYRTLFDAVRSLPVKLRVVCDSGAMLEGLHIPRNVTVLRSCYGEDYVRELMNAEAVVVPLGVRDISAGQMVLLEAMACGRPTIITRTPTVEDYVSHGHESLLVPPGDVQALREAIVRLENDKALAAALGAAAREAFEARFTMRVFVRNLVAAVSR